MSHERSQIGQKYPVGDLKLDETKAVRAVEFHQQIKAEKIQMLGDLRGFMPDVYESKRQTRHKKNKVKTSNAESIWADKHHSTLLSGNPESMLSGHLLLPNVQVADYTNFITENHKEVQEQLQHADETRYSQNIIKIRESLAELNQSN